MFLNNSGWNCVLGNRLRRNECSSCLHERATISTMDRPTTCELRSFMILSGLGNLHRGPMSLGARLLDISQTERDYEKILLRELQVNLIIYLILINGFLRSYTVSFLHDRNKTQYFNYKHVPLHISFYIFPPT